MAVGNYGTIRPADVALDDIEVFLHYTPSRNEIGDETITKLNTIDILSENEFDPNNDGNFKLFSGTYTLTLPRDVFNDKGIYTIIIKPLEIRTKITDTGVLAAKSDIKGLIFDSALPEVDEVSGKFANDGLVGYRIEYISKETGLKERNMFRIITSNNKVDSANVNMTNTSQKAIKYVFNDNSTLVFCTVTPSSTSNTKPNATPFIGESDQEVIITNTFFNPIQIEIEMVEHDIETIAYGIYGPQTKSIKDGIFTNYNFDKEIYKQYNLFEILDEFGEPLFEIKEPKTNIDTSKDFDDISNV